MPDEDRRMDLVRGRVVREPPAGTRRVWTALPPDTRRRGARPRSEARALAGPDEVDGDDVLPGFRLRIARIFTS